MFDIGWTELLLIGVVALIVVGPKDLPHLFHSLGRFTAKARGMAREFTSAMEDAAKTSGLDEAAGTLRDVKSLTSKKALGLDALDRAAERFEKWEPKIPDSRTKAQPDPGAEDASAGDRASPAGAAASAAAGVQATALAAAAHGRADAKDGTAEGEAPAGTRRLRAVRRSDMKDD